MVNIKKVFFGGDLSYKEIVSGFIIKSTPFIEVKEIEDADLIYWVYGKGPTLNFKNLNFWLTNSKKFILHWIGTDVVTHLAKMKSRNLKSFVFHGIWNMLILRKVKKGSMINLCCAPWLCEELKEVGIISSYLPLTTIKKELYDFPENERTFDFMSYLPQGRMDLYNGAQLINIARIMRNYRFIIIIPDINNICELKLKNIPDNVCIIPKVDFSGMTSIYRNSKCFLRFTSHDGLSLSVMESLANRLQVFWTYKFPYVYNVNLNDEDSLLANLLQVIKNWKPNFDGQTYVLNNLNLAEIEQKSVPIFLKLYDNNH